MGARARSWLVRRGRLRAVWRLLLFVALSTAILTGLLVLLPAVVTLPPVDEERITIGLVAQSALILVAAVVAGAILLRWVDREPLGRLGWTVRARLPAELLLGLGVGALAIVLAVTVVWIGGGYRFVGESGTPIGWAASVGASLAWLALPAAAEEAVFRGYPLHVLKESAGSLVAVLVTSALFALVHGANPNVGVIGLVNIFLAGVLLAFAVLRTGSLWFATAVHLGWNWATAGLLDLPVSGLEAFDPPLYDGLAVGAPAWLNGGAFGPEGGLVGTTAALVALAGVWGLTGPGGRLARVDG